MSKAGWGSWLDILDDGSSAIDVLLEYDLACEGGELCEEEIEGEFV